MKMFSCCKKEEKSHSNMIGLGLIGLLLGVIAALVFTKSKAQLESVSSGPNVLYVPIKD